MLQDAQCGCYIPCALVQNPTRSLIRGYLSLRAYFLSYTIQSRVKWNAINLQDLIGAFGDSLHWGKYTLTHGRERPQDLIDSKGPQWKWALWLHRVILTFPLTRALWALAELMAAFLKIKVSNKINQSINRLDSAKGTVWETRGGTCHSKNEGIFFKTLHIHTGKNVVN